MENWKKGDTAICVMTGKLPYNLGKGELPSLRLDAQYIVNAVRICECGKVTLDVGLNTKTREIGTRCECGALSSPKTGIHWCASERFVKPKSDKGIEEQETSLDKQLEDAIKEGNQEKIDELLDKMNKISNPLIE